MASGVVDVVNTIVSYIMKAIVFFLKLFLKGLAHLFFSSFFYGWNLIKNLDKIMR